MAAKKSGLGRGLDSLFADTGSSTAESGAEVSVIPLSDVEPDKNQPRKTFEGQPLAELAKSIEEHGVLQPILVRPNPTGGYSIVAGERRWRAARLAGLREIPAVVRDVPDAQALELALIENLQREDLDPVEEALGYHRLMERCGYTQEEVAQRLARSRSSVANSLRLLALPAEVRDMLKAGTLNSGHAKALLSLPSAARQSEAAARIAAEKLSVRRTEALCKRLQKEARLPRPQKPRPSMAAEVEITLREFLGTEVRVEYEGGRGWLKIGFYSDEQLYAFTSMLGRCRPQHADGAHSVKDPHGADDPYSTEDPFGTENIF